jgi:ribosomal protein S4
MAKSLTRAYHGEQIREGKWTRMFDRRLPAVVPMDYRLLARTDGSEEAQGRGSGLTFRKKKDDSEDSERERAPQRTPYMHMTYFPTERRLDTAVWRALFASSARQARQFVVHGSVKVNGKKVGTLLCRHYTPQANVSRWFTLAISSILATCSR